MAHYQGRKGPNVSQYIANLNTIPSATDLTQHGQDFAPTFDDDLFTAEFLDFDVNAPVNDVASNFNNFNGGQQQQVPSPNAADKMGFVNQPNFFPMPQFQPNGGMSGHSSLPTSPPNGLPFAGHMQQSQPTIPSAHHFADSLSPHQGQQPQVGQKRKVGSSGTTIETAAELEEESRQAAEEDKRRRNTAASARFRVKKKQREQTLEKTAKEMSDRVQVLEARIGQLEMENQWLKGLITEKNVTLEGAGLKSDSGEGEVTVKQTKGKTADITDAEDEKMTEAERSPSEKKRGVGTHKEATKA